MSFLGAAFSRTRALGNGQVQRVPNAATDDSFSDSAWQRRYCGARQPLQVRGNRRDMLLYYLVTCLCVVALCLRFPDGAVFLVGGYLALLLSRRA